MSRRTDDDEHRIVVKNSHSSRDNRRDGRRDVHQRPEKRRSDAERCHDSSPYHRRRSMGDDEHRRTAGRRDERWVRERDEQRPKRRDRPAFTEEAAQHEPVDPDKPSWQNNKVRKHAEMLKERKLLWKGKSGAGGDGEQHETTEEREAMMTTTSDDSKPVVGTEAATERKEKKLEHKWQSMIAATAQDTQQMDKFQRLMGMKKNTTVAPAVTSSTADPADETDSQSAVHGPAAPPPVPDTSELSRERMRQLELQRGLNQQFELARQSHHGARGRAMSAPPPYNPNMQYPQQPQPNYGPPQPGYGGGGYGYPSQPYPQQPGAYGSYPQQQQPQPQVVYVEREGPRQQSSNNCCLWALLACCCGCCLADCCD